MWLLREFSPETEKLLLRISKQSKSHQVRQRANCIILRYQGFSLPQLTQIFRVSRKTLYNWFNRWEKQGLIGLYNQKGRGRKAIFNQEQQEQIKQWVEAEPKRLKKVIVKMNEQWGIKVHKETVKRIIKKFKMRWKRLKRGLAKPPAEWELEVKMPKLKELKEQEQKGEIDLRYLDESGFSLWPCIPYAWQAIAETISLKSCVSKRINILGLMNKKNEIFYEIKEETIDSNTVISFLDKFCQNLDKPTVVVMDQASIHTSDRLIKKLKEWEEKNLRIFWLPAYSPQENLIEILWKFMKYEWITIEAYESRTNLLNYLRKILDNLGTEYVINFV